MELTNFSVVDFGMALWRVCLALMVCVSRDPGLDAVVGENQFTVYPERPNHG
jgi:hypothetical protein